MLRADGLSSSQVIQLIRTSLNSPDPEVRRQAPGLVSERVLARPDEAADLLVLVPVLDGLVIAESDEHVRRAAVIARANLDYAVRGGALSNGLIAMFAGRYGAEPSERVRVQLVRALALSNGQQPPEALREVLLAALADPVPDVVRYAVRGLAALRATEALPALEQLLGSDDRTVRIQVAAAFSAYGPAARSSRPALERHLAVETDDIVRATLTQLLSSD